MCWCSWCPTGFAPATSRQSPLNVEVVWPAALPSAKRLIKALLFDWPIATETGCSGSVGRPRTVKKVGLAFSRSESKLSRPSSGRMTKEVELPLVGGWDSVAYTQFSMHCVMGDLTVIAATERHR